MGGGPRWLEGGSESSDDEIATPACSDTESRVAYSGNFKSVISCVETGEGDATVTFPPICFGSLPASQGFETLEPLVLQVEKAENDVPDTVQGVDSLEPLVVQVEEAENDVPNTVDCNSPVVVVVAEPGLEVEAVGPKTPRPTDLEDVGGDLEGVSVHRNVVHEVGKVFQAEDIGGPTLHRLMHLRVDERDQSSVEKIILPPDAIEKFCNEAMLNSAACRDGKTLLDFNALNNVSVHVVGLYGSKKVIARIFSKLGFHTVVSSMLGSLDAGIYGFLHQGLLFIFYWHQGEQMLEASRKDVSCNFIRYVADLCATVYICIDDENDVALSRMPAASTKQRTQRLQISKVRQSENDVKLRKGFHICPVHLPRKTPGNVETSSCSQPSLRFAGGVHRCAFLTSSVVPPTKVRRRNQQVLQIQNLAQVVGEWSASFKLKCSRLPYRELCLFLEHAGLEGSRDYGLLRESFEARRSTLTEKLYKVQEEEEEKISRIFNRAQKAYLELYHPSPEIVDVTSEVHPSGSASSQLQKSSEPITNDLLQADAALVNIWTGLKAGKEFGSTFLFVGTEFMIEVEGTKLRSVDTFIVLGISSARSSRLAGPILYGEEFVVRPRRAENQIKMACQALYEDCPEGPVLPSRLMKLTIRHVSSQDRSQVDLKARLVTGRPSGKGMLAWMESYGKLVVAPIKERIDALRCALTDPSVQSDAIRARFFKDAEEMLKSPELLSQFKERFSKQAVEQLLKESEVNSPSLSVGVACDKVTAEEWDVVVRLLGRVHLEACAEFSCAVQTMVKNEICPMLMKKIQFEAKRDANLLKQSFEREERRFVTRLQEQLSRGRDREHCLSVRRCFLQSGQKEARNIVSGRSSEGETCDKLEVHYVTEQTVSERIAWNLAELTTMKNDLGAFMCDSAHRIIPKCSENNRYIEVDTNSERLCEVVAVKSGEVLVFVEDLKQPAVHLFVLPRLGAEIQDMTPVKTFKRGFALVAVDEVSKLVGFYHRALDKIEIQRFDDSFRPMDWSGVTLDLSEYPGMRFLTSMSFIPGRREMVLVDEEFKVRVFEISHPAILRPGHMQLPGPAHKICVSTDGSCLMAFYKSLPDGPSPAAEGLTQSSGQNEHTQLEMDESAGGSLKIEVYLLGESMCHLKTLLLDYAVADVKTIDATIVSFESQVHLVLLDASRPDRGICSEAVEITAASDVCRLQHVDRGFQTAISSVGFTEKVGHGCPALDYIYQIFEKFATSPPLIKKTRDLHLHLVFAGESKEKVEALKHSSVSYVNGSMDKLERDNGKDFSHLRLAVSAGTVDSYIVQNFLVQSTEGRHSVKLGDWVRQLVCLVPIQLARAEKNTFRPLVDGLQNSNLNHADAVGVAQALRFGFYDSVLADWSGNIKVISSMGGRSSGKSYLLNHLAGSLFDVAEGRCTDGVWMTMRASQSCLYVLLDFEGLGSYDRSEQEDMLLSALNTAVSNITIFNKKDFHLDKETEAVFERFQNGVSLVRFQNGVSLVKQENRLSKGLFYMAIKDVDASDVNDAKAEFSAKILQICHKSQDNFLTKMYGGAVEIAAMPPFQRSEYPESVAEIAATVEELEAVHQNGNSFAVDLKLVMAQITTRIGLQLTRRLSFETGFPPET